MRRRQPDVRLSNSCEHGPSSVHADSGPGGKSSRNEANPEASGASAAEDLWELKEGSTAWPARFQTLEELLTDAFVVYDVHGRVLHVNSLFEDLFGWKCGEIFGRSIPYVPPGEDVTAGNEFRAALAGRSSPLKAKRVTKEGRVLDVIMWGTRIFDSARNIVGLVVVIRENSSAPCRHAPPACITRLGEPEHAAAEGNPTQGEAVRLLITRVQEYADSLENRLAKTLNVTVRPLIDHLRSSDLSESQAHVVDTLEFSIRHFASRFGLGFAERELGLSPREIEICQMIRAGKDSRQIANALGIAYNTVILYRKRIRKKLGLKKDKRNLELFIRDNIDSITCGSGSLFRNV